MKNFQEHPQSILLTDSLSTVLKRLHPDGQYAIAAIILAELESEIRWDETFARSPDLLAKLASVAMTEHRAGKTQTLDFHRCVDLP